jgi:uncharacterized RDD family membrane protein YckC
MSHMWIYSYEINHRVKYTKASFWSRLLAWLIDTVILSAAALAVKYIFFPNAGTDLYWIWYFVYNVVMERYFGKTIGKRMLNLVVIRSNGESPNWLTSINRNIAKNISILPYGFGYLRILAPHRAQTIHDEFARSYVVQD